MAVNNTNIVSGNTFEFPFSGREVSIHCDSFTLGSDSDFLEKIHAVAIDKVFTESSCQMISRAQFQLVNKSIEYINSLKRSDFEQGLTLELVKKMYTSQHLIINPLSQALKRRDFSYDISFIELKEVVNECFSKCIKMNLQDIIIAQYADFPRQVEKKISHVDSDTALMLNLFLLDFYKDLSQAYAKVKTINGSLMSNYYIERFLEKWDAVRISGRDFFSNEQMADLFEFGEEFYLLHLENQVK